MDEIKELKDELREEIEEVNLLNEPDLDQFTEIDEALIDPSFKPEYKTVDSAREELEDLLIDALRDVLKEGKPDIKLKAINTGIELLGLKAEVMKMLVGDQNIQINMDQKKPEITNALLKSITGIKDVTKGTVNEIKTQKGGRGA